MQSTWPMVQVQSHHMHAASKSDCIFQNKQHVYFHHQHTACHSVALKRLLNVSKFVQNTSSPEHNARLLHDFLHMLELHPGSYYLVLARHTQVNNS